MLDISTILSLAIPAGACVLASFLLALRYGASPHVSKTVKALDSAAEKLTSLPPCDMANLAGVTRITESEFAPVKYSKLAESWQWYASDTGALYLNQAAPSPKAYFPLDILIENLRIKNDYIRFSFLTIFLSLFSFIICVAVPLFSDETEMLGIGFAIGAIAFLVSLLAFVMTTLSYRSKLRSVTVSLASFTTLLSSRLVGADAPNNTSVILRSNKEAMESFQKSVEALTEKIEGFVQGQITPAIAECFNKSISEHIAPALNNLNAGASESLNRLSAEYQKILTVDEQISSYLNESKTAAASVAASANSLTAAANETSSMVKQISSRNDEISNDIATRLGGLSSSLDEFTAKLNEGLQSNSQTAAVLADAMQRITALSDEHISESAKTASSIIETMTQRTSAAIEQHFSKYALQTADDVRHIMDSNSRTAEALAQSVIKIDEAGASQFEKASAVAASMITDISNEMRIAMQHIGSDVAESIQQAYKENEKYVNNLTERTEKLIREYEAYFEGMDKNTKHIMADMDFVVTGALTRMSDDITAIIDSFNKSVSESAERYEVNSKELILSFTEQTRDMGLYAHEINIDITSLTATLRDSVKDFNLKMQQGIGQTFTEFDRGLAEFTKRMMNTIEAIRESVDSLPMVIASLQKK